MWKCGCRHEQRLDECPSDLQCKVVQWERVVLEDSCAGCDVEYNLGLIRSHYEQEHKHILGQMVAARRQGDKVRVAELEKVDKQLWMDNRKQITTIERGRTERNALYPECRGSDCHNFRLD